MPYLQVDALSLEQERAIHALWNNEFPMTIFHNELRDTQTYLKNLINPHHVFYVEDGIKAWYCDFDRDGMRFFVMILNKKIQGKGIGSALLTMAKKRLKELNGWIVLNETYQLANGNIYKSPSEFYTKNNFKINHEKSSLKNKLNIVLITWEC